MYIMELTRSEFMHLEVRQILIEDETHLQRIIRLAEEAKYSIRTIKKTNLDSSQDFIDELKKDSKPDDLVYGTDNIILCGGKKEPKIFREDDNQEEDSK